MPEDGCRGTIGAAEMKRRIAELEASIAELLDACRVLAFCGLDTKKDCDGCALNDADMRVEIDPTAACDGLHELLRKIGIEVD